MNEDLKKKVPIDFKTEIEEGSQREDTAWYEWMKHIENNNSEISHYFYGIQKEQTECPNCHNKNLRFVPYNTISCSLDNIKKNNLTKVISLQNCLENELTKATKLDQSNKWYCSNCEVEREAHRKTLHK